MHLRRLLASVALVATTVTAVVVVTPAVVAAQIPEVQAAELAVTAPDAEGVRHVSWERWYPETGEPVVTAWLVEAPGIDPVETEPDAVGADLVGLSPTAVVDVEVTARTAAGDATPVVVESDPEVVPPSAAPSELDVRGTAVEGELAISWGDPAAIDPTIETVRLGWPTGFADVEVDDPQPYVLSGVPEGLAVEVTARSRSLVGWSPVAIAPPIAPGSPTAGPTGVSAEATGEPGTVTVSWGAVPSGGTGRSAISGFEITWPGGSESAGSTATELEIDGLEDGVPVVFSVAAANGAGPGVRAAASPVTPSGPPTEEPAGVAAVATGTSGVVSVSWDPFDEDGDGGSPVTGFEVQTGEQLVEVGASATEAELEDLVDGTEAVVEVRAVNANGPGPAASVEVVPEGPPSAAPDLTAVVATGDAGELEVRWDPLAAGETGGSAITGYEIDAGVGDPPVTVAAALDEVVLEGLVDGTEHPVRVRARNEHGAGPWSDVVEATPGTPPDPPHAIVVEAVTPTSLRIRWQGVEPDRQGSAPVDSYVISGAGPEVEVFYGYNAWVIEDLVPGQAYQLQMRARNAHGDGPRSAPTDPFVPGAPTAAPTDVAAEGTGVNGELRVTWTEIDPVDAGPDGLTGYVVEVEGAAPVEVGPEVDEAVVTGLGDDPVTVTVRARNAIGMGPASDPSAPASPHGPPTAAPTGVSVTSPGSSGDLVIEWEPVTADGGSPITAYEVRWGPGEDQVVVAGPEDVTASFGGLEDGVPHSFTVRARNADGDGPASEPVTARPGQAPTSGPSDVAATPTGAVGEVLVTWSPLAPEDVGTGPITGYRVDWGSGSTEVGPEAVTYLVEGLEVGSQYQVAVTALSEFGPGPASAWVDVFANAAPGDAPTGVVAVPTGVGGRVRVTWNPLPGGGQWGRYADTWIVTWDGGSTSLPVGRTTLEISGLDPEVDVAFRVRASNALGLGPLSEPSDAVRAGGLAPRPNLLDPESASNEQGDLGWVPVGVDIARSAMVAHDGVASLRVTSHGPGYEGTAPLVVSGVGDAGTAVEEGQTYRASFWVSAADVSRQATAFLSWSDAEGREMTMDAGTPVDEVVDGWVQVEVEATAPVGATHVAVGVAFDDAATGEVHHVDGAVLTTDEVDAPNLLSPVQSTMEGGEVRWVSRLGTTTRSTSLGAAGGHVALLLRQDELSTSGESATAFLPATALPTVAPGQEWSAAAWVRRGNRTSEVALRIGFLTADGLLLSSTTVDAREIGTEDWEELRGSAVVPDGAVAMTVGIAMVGGGWGDVVGLDEVAVWAGSPQDCCSNVLAVPDRSMETGDSGWVGDGFAVGRVGQATRDGYVALRLTPGSGGNTFVRTDPGTNGVPVLADHTYTASAWILPEAAPRTVGAAIEWYDAGGASIGVDPGPEVTEREGDWVQVSATGVAPANAAYASLYVGVDADPQSLVHRVDAAAVCVGSSPDCIGEQPPAMRPTDLVAGAGDADGRVALSWDVPGDLEAERVTGYLVTWDGGELEVEGPAARAAVVDGLDPDVAYRFEIAAVNPSGAGPVAGPTPDAYAAGLPTRAPGDVVVEPTGQSGQLRVTWSDPPPRGLPITSFVVRWGETGEEQVSIGVGTTLLTGLTDGEPVAVTVAAVNSRGEGPASDPVSARPGVEPQAGPSDLLVIPTGANGELAVTWDALDPADIGTGPITGYRVRWGDRPEDQQVVDPTPTGTTLTGLVDGRTYEVGVAAVSEYGVGPVSEAEAIPVGPPTRAPSGVVARPTGLPGRAQLEWGRLPSSAWGGARGTIQIEWADGATEVAYGSTSATVSGLDAVEPTTFRLRAVNAHGAGPWSAWSAPVRPDDRSPHPNLFQPDRAGFETGDLGWAGEHGTIQRTGDDAHGGIFSLVLTATEDVDPALEGPAIVTPSGTAGVPVTAGSTYSVSAMVVDAAYDGSLESVAALTWYDAEGRDIGRTPGEWTSSAEEWFTEVSAEAVAPAGAAFVGISIAFPGTESGRRRLVDDVVLAEVVEGGGAPNLLTPWASTFEGDDLGWGAGRASIGRSADRKPPGDDNYVSLEVTLDERAALDGGVVYANPGLDGMEVVPGETYTGRFLVNAQEGISEVTGVVIFFDADGVPMTNDYGEGLDVESSSVEWAEISVPAVAPPGAASASVGALFEGDPGASAYIDLVEFFAGSSGVGPNQMPAAASTFEGGASPGWISDGGAVARSADEARQGTVSLRVGEGVGRLESAAITEFGTNGIPVAPGRSYTASGWIRPQGDDPAQAVVMIAFFDAAGRMVAMQEPAPDELVAEVVGDWVQMSTTRPSPGNAAFATLAFFVEGTGIAQGVHYIDDVAFCLGTSPDCVGDGRPTLVPTDVHAGGVDLATETTDVAWAADDELVVAEGVTGFRIEWDGGHLEVEDPSARSATVGGLDPEVEHTFTVAARNDVGLGSPSVPSEPTTAQGPPTVAPSGLVARPSGVPGRMDLTWSRFPMSGWHGNSDGGFEVEWDGGATTASATATRTSVSGLDPETSLAFRIRAVNALGDGPWSAWSRPATAGDQPPLPNLFDDERSGFEPGAGWVGQGASVQRVDTVAHGGVVALEVRTETQEDSAAGAPSVLSGGAGPVPVTPGVDYLASVAVTPTSDGAERALAWLVWFDDAGDLLASDGGTAIDGMTQGTWSEVTAQGAAPEGAVSAAIRVSFPGDAGGHSYAIDDAVFAEVAVDPTPNLLAEGEASFELDPLGWSASYSSLARTGEAGAVDGVVSLRVDIDERADEEHVAGLSLDPARSGAAVVAGTQYSAQVRALAQGSSISAVASITFVDAAGVALARTDGAPAVVASESEWATAGVSAVAPAGAVRMIVGLAFPGAGADDFVWVDAVTLVRGSLLAPTSVNRLDETASSFEHAPLGWLSQGGAVGRSADDARQGLVSLRVGSTGFDDTIAYTEFGTHGIPVDGSRAYTASVWVKPQVGSERALAHIAYFDADGEMVAGSESDEDRVVWEIPDDWVQVTHTQVAPPDAAYAAIGLEVAGEGGAGVHYLDDASLCLGVSPDCLPDQPPVVIPSDLDAEREDAVSGVRLSWNQSSRPEDDVTGYRVEWDGGSEDVSGAETTELVIPDVVTESRTYTVRALNDRGVGLPSDPVMWDPAALVPTQAPTSVVATATGRSGQVRLSWAALPEGSDVVTGYVVTWDGGRRVVGSDRTRLVVSGLVDGETYELRVTARNGAGLGPESAPASAVPGVALTAAPTEVTAEQTAGGTIHVTWSGLAGETPTGYVVRWGTSPSSKAEVGPEVRELDIPGLAMGQLYTITVAGRNAFGSGPSSAGVEVRILAPPTAAPTGVRVFPGAVPGTAHVEWNPLSLVRWGGAVGSMIVSWPGGATSVDGAITQVTVQGIDPGEPVTFELFARNDLGDGPTATSRAVRLEGRTPYPNLFDEGSAGAEEPAAMGWVGHEATITSLTQSASTGVSSLGVLPTAVGGGARSPRVRAPAPGATVEASAHALGDRVMAAAQLVWFDAAGHVLAGGPTGTPVPLSISSWLSVEVSGVVPATATHVALDVVAVGQPSAIQIDTARIARETAGDPGLNLLSEADQDFEAVTIGWTGEGATTQRSFEEAHQSDAALRIEAVPDAPEEELGPAAVLSIPGSADLAGTSVTASAWLRDGEDGPTGARVGLATVHETGGSVFWSPRIVGPSWGHVEIQAEIPAGTERVFLVVELERGAGTVAFADDLEVVRDADPGRSLLPALQADLERAPFSWVAMGGYVGRAIDSTRDGEVSFRTTGIGGETFIVSDWASGGVPVDPGEVYTAGAWVRPETTPRGLTAQIVWFGVDGLPIDFTLPAIFTASEIADDWVQVANTGTAPEGARTASLLLAWHGASAGRVSHIDQASFCQGADVDCIPSGDPISTVRNVTAAATSSSGELSVRWNPLAAARVTAEGVDGYRVSWPGGTVDVAGAAADGVVVDGLVDGEPVVFEVRTLAGSATGPPASSRTPIAPGSPVGIVHGLRSVVDGDDVVLSWDPVDAAVEGGVAPVSAIVVHRSDDEAEGAVLSDDAVGYTLEDLRRGTSVVVTVRLRNAHGDAGRSRRLSITVPATTPEASPSGLQGYADGERIHLEWDQVADDGGSPITAYEIDYSGWSQTVDAYDLVPGERVRGIVWSTNATEIVKVRGVNAHGTGPWSDSIEIATGTTPATPGPDLVDPSAPGSVVEWLSTGADVWVSAGGGRDGGRGLAVQPDGDDAVVATPTGTDGVVVPPGTERLALGAQVRGPSTAEARVDARWYDSVGRRIASADGAFVPLGTDWTEVAIDAEVPSGAAHVSLVVVFVGANGSPVHVDDATVMAEGSTTELLDGALTGLEQAPWAIVGARGGRVARAGGGGMHLEGTAPSIAMASRPVPATEGAWRLCADVRSDRSAVATATVRWVSDVGTPLETDVGPTTTIGSAAQPVCVDAEVEGDDLSAVLEIGVQASTAPVVDVTGIDFEHIAHPEEVLPADVASLEPGGELQGEGRPARRTPDGYADDGAAEVRSASGTHSLTTSMGHPAVVTPGSPYTGGAWVLPDLGTSASLVARVHWTDAEGDPVGVSRLATVAPTIQWSMVAGTAIAPPQAAFARITIEVEGGPVRADDPFLCTGVSTSCVGAGPPAPPVDVVTDLQGDDDGEGGAVLTWTAPDEDGVHEGEEITGYRVGRGWNETYVPAVPGAEQGTTIADLDIGEHSFTVAAVNAYGDGPPSEPLTVAIGPASADLIGAPGDPSIDGGWDGVDATVQRTAVAQHSGRYALEVTAVAPDRGGAGATIPLGEVPTGASITSAWVATSSGNEQVQLWAEWFDAEGDLAVESLVATVNATTTWKVLTRNRWTAPAGATRGRLVVACTTCAPGESVFVDDVDVTGSSLAGAGATTTFEPEADPIRHGTGATLSLAAHPGGGDAVLAAHLRATSATVGVELPVTAPASGTTVTASVPVRSVGAGTQARLRARWLDASGAELAAVDGTEVAVGAEDVDLVAVTTVPADGARLALDVLVTGTVGTIVEVGSARAATADDAWSVTTALDDDDSVRWLSAPGSGVVAAMADPGDPAVGPVALPRAGVATASTAQGLAGIPVSPGVPLGAVVSVRTPPGGSGVTGHVELVWFDEAGDALGTTVGTTGAIGSDPVALSVRCGAPADAATAAIRVVGSARLAIARAWVDHREEETDCDGDGITDFAEAVNGTNPASDDSDGDGVTDRNELLTLGEQDPLDPVTDGSATPDGERDHDGDGLDALEEQAAGSSPVAGDTDADGIGDAVEVGDGSDPDQSDSDADGVDDVDEVAAGTSPTSADSDGDGAPDDVDVAAREYGLDAGAAVTVTGAGATLAQLRPALVTNHLATARGLVAEPVRFQVNEDVAVPQVHETVLPQRSGTPSSGALLVRRFEPSTGKWVPLAPEEATATRVGGGISIQAGGTGIFGAFDVALTELQWGLPDLGQSCGGREGTDLVFLDVGFTIDSSGSMSWNDVDNVRLHATNAIASHLHPDDRAAVVDFDSQAIVRQGLTHDMQLVKDALEQVDASGGTNIEAGVGAALDVLAGATDPDRAQAIVLFTDGQGAWSDAMLQQVIDANVRVFTISLGDDIDEVLLRRIANETLGVYTHADDSTDIEPAFDFIRDHLLDTQRDSDKDGVSDCEEVNGSRDANGEPFTSEPDDPDSDNDGLTDGQEVGQKIFRRQESPGSIGWYRPVFSDPMEGDSDGDLLLDPTERDEGTEARDIDTDIDGLWDGEERTAGTSPFGDDTDGDGHIDAFEWRGERLGFSPVYEDHHVSQAQWLDDFYFGFQDDDNQWGIHSWSASAMFELRTRHSMADHLCPDREPTMPPEDELNSGEECVGDVAGRFQCAKRTLNELRAEAGLNGVTFGEVVGDSYTPWTQVGPIEPPLLPIGAGSCTMFPRVRLTTVRDYIENTIAQDRDWTRATVAAVSRSTRARTGTSNATNPVPAGEWDASVFNLVADHAGTAPGFRTQARMEGGTADYLLIAGFSYAGIDRLAEGRASLPVVAEAVFYGRPEHHRYTYQFFADSPSGHRRLASHKGEDYVRHFLYPPFPPASGPIKHHVFDGGRPDRIPDHVQGRLMFEVKVGVATGASRIRSEVQRDVEIREREPLDPVWLFFGSLTPGTLGPNRPLQDLLYAQNIPWVVHPV